MNSLLQDILLKVTKNEGTVFRVPYQNSQNINPYVYKQKILTHTAYNFAKEGLCETCKGTLMFSPTGPRWREYGTHLHLTALLPDQPTIRVASPISAARSLTGTDPPERCFPYRAPRLLARQGNSGNERQN